VFAVPGDITRENSRGCNALIQSGAKLVQSADDILAEMHGVLRGLVREQDASAAAPNDRAPSPAASLSPEEQMVYELLRQEPQCFDVLLSQLDPERFGVQQLATVLLSLEMKRCIKQLPGRLYAVLQ
jgi:DNA processing protein